MGRIISLTVTELNQGNVEKVISILFAAAKSLNDLGPENISVNIIGSYPEPTGETDETKESDQ